MRYFPTIIPWLACLAACGPQVPPSSTPPSSPKALVTMDQYQRAYNIIKGIDYLPFGVTRDGCYARALFMSMELAAERIQSSSTFAIAASGTVLMLNDGTRWTYHVAPMMQVPGYAQMITDPSMAAEPMRLDIWLNSIRGQGASVYSLPGSYYGYWYGSTVYQSNIVSSFEAMPPFRVEDMRHACQSAYRFLGEDPTLTSEQLLSKRQKLLQRVVDLGQRLSSLSKLSNENNYTSYDCQQ